MKLLKQLLAVVLVFLLIPGLLFAQKKSSDWSNVEKLNPGARVIVSTKQGREYAGEKRKTIDDTLFLEIDLPVHGTRIITLSRDEIAEVRKKRSRVFQMIIGGAAGAGAGAAIGDSVYDHRGGDDPHAGALIIGLIGVLIGVAVAGHIPKKAKRIYVAP